MLVKDEALQTRHDFIGHAEAYAAQVKDWVADKIKYEQFYLGDQTPLSRERQRGRQMTAQRMEELLRPYLPSSMRFLPHPTNRTKRFIGQEVAGTLVTVVVYESGLMPEHSLQEKFEEEVWDGITSHIDRADIKPDSDTPVGVRKAITASREIERGWRTVIIRLVQEGVLTPAEAERVFGAANRTEWAKAMGHKATKDVPW